MEYAVGIRIVFSGEVSSTLKQEKDRFVVEYGSKYKTEPHITLWRDRHSTEKFLSEIFPGLMRGLQDLHTAPFTFSLLGPKIIREEHRHRNLYIVDVSDKEKIQALATEISDMAVRHHGLSEYPIDPHITLGAIAFDHVQANLEDVQKNLQSLKDKEITVSHLAVVLDGKEAGAERFKLIKGLSVPLHSKH